MTDSKPTHPLHKETVAAIIELLQNGATAMLTLTEIATHLQSESAASFDGSVTMDRQQVESIIKLTVHNQQSSKSIGTVLDKLVRQTDAMNN